jgi:hypothetical protein
MGRVRVRIEPERSGGDKLAEMRRVSAVRIPVPGFRVSGCCMFGNRMLCRAVPGSADMVCIGYCFRSVMLLSQCDVRYRRIHRGNYPGCG